MLRTVWKNYPNLFQISLKCAENSIKLRPKNSHLTINLILCKWLIETNDCLFQWIEKNWARLFRDKIFWIFGYEMLKFVLIGRIPKKKKFLRVFIMRACCSFSWQKTYGCYRSAQKFLVWILLNEERWIQFFVLYSNVLQSKSKLTKPIYHKRKKKIKFEFFLCIIKFTLYFNQEMNRFIFSLSISLRVYEYCVLVNMSFVNVKNGISR